MLAELSSNMGNSNLPVQDELVLLLGPAAQQVGESAVVDDVRNGAVHLLPHRTERRLGLTALAVAPALQRAFDESQHLADTDRLRGARQQVAALRATARFHKAPLLQSRED